MTREAALRLAEAVAQYESQRDAYRSPDGEWGDGVLHMQRSYAEQDLGQAIAALIEDGTLSSAALASAPSDPEPVAGLDVDVLRRVLIEQGFAYQNWQNGDIDLPREDVEKVADEYARLSDRRHLLEAERQRQVRENEPERGDVR